MLENEPKQYHQNLNTDLMMNTCTLSVTAGMKNTSSVLCIAAELKGDENGDDNWNEDTKKSVDMLIDLLGRVRRMGVSIKIMDTAERI